MQKRSNNFYIKNETKFANKNQENEGNDNYDNNSKFQFSESKANNFTNKLNSPFITEKRNFLINSDYKSSEKQFLFESANKISNNTNYFQNEINPRYSGGINTKYYTDYKRENKESYYNEIQSKVYKKVVEQIYNNLHIYCKKLISNDYSKFLNNIKKLALLNEPKIKQKTKPNPKTYQKKNIMNTNKYKFKKTPDKINQNRNMISNFNNEMDSINNNVKPKVIYSNNYNWNYFGNNENNRYIYSNKNNKTNITKEFSNKNDKNSISQKNINLNSINDFSKKNENFNNVINNYSQKKNILNIGLRRNSYMNYMNLIQDKTSPAQKSVGKNNLKIENKNSLVFVNYSTKKKLFDKLQNIKLFKQSTNDNIDKKFISEEENFETKKRYFKELIINLKSITFCKHLDKFVEIKNKTDKTEVFEKLKKNLETKKEKSEEEKEKNENDKTLKNINENIDNIKNEENKQENINLDKEEISNENKKEITDNNKEEIDIKNIEISNEIVEPKLNEELNNDKKEKDFFDEQIEENNNNLKDKKSEKTSENDFNTILTNNEENKINEKENFQSNNFEEKKEDKNLDIISKEILKENMNIDSQFRKEKNENEKDKYGENLDNLINSLNNNEEEVKSDNDNFHKNPNIEDNQREIKDNENINFEESKNDHINKSKIKLEKIIQIILLKEKYNIIKESFIKWKQMTQMTHEDIKEEKEAINLSHKINKEKVDIDEDKKNLQNKTSFLDEIDDEEKKEVLEEMVFIFRTLLMSSCFQSKEKLSDSVE